jgi:hypothetical protein
MTTKDINHIAIGFVLGILCAVPIAIYLFRMAIANQVPV